MPWFSSDVCMNEAHNSQKNGPIVQMPTTTAAMMIKRFWRP